MRRTLSGLVTVRRFGELVDMTAPAVRAGIRRGDIPAVRLGKRRLRIPLGALTQFVQPLTDERRPCRGGARGDADGSGEPVTRE